MSFRLLLSTLIIHLISQPFTVNYYRYQIYKTPSHDDSRLSRNHSLIHDPHLNVSQFRLINNNKRFLFEHESLLNQIINKFTITTAVIIHQIIYPKLSIIILYSVIMPLTSAQYSPWTNDSQFNPPRSAQGSAIAFNEETNAIYVIGGEDYPKQFVEYRLDSSSAISSIIDHGPYYFNLSLTLYGQCFVQHGDTLYMMPHGYPHSIHSFMISKQTLHIDQFFLPMGDYKYGDCIASMTMEHDYLIVTGGKNGSVHVTLKLEAEPSSD